MAMVASMVAVVTAGTGIAGYIEAGTSAAIGAGRTRGIAASGGDLRHALRASLHSGAFLCASLPTAIFAS
jgi:hypothetical protein